MVGSLIPFLVHVLIPHKTTSAIPMVTAIAEPNKTTIFNLFSYSISQTELQKNLSIVIWYY
jgi:hypothetical protein